MWDEPWQKIARPWLGLLFWIACAAVLVFAFRQLIPLFGWVVGVISPFLIGLILAYVFNPIVAFVQRRLRLGRVGGIMVLIAAATLVFAAMLFWLVPVLYQQLVQGVHELSEAVVALYGTYLKDRLDAATQKAIETQFGAIRGELAEYLRNLLSNMGGMIRPVAQGSVTAVRSVAGGVASVVGAVFGFFAGVAFVTLITFYFLVDLERIPPIVRRLLPVARRERIWDILVKADQAVGGFLRGQLIACVIVGVLTAILLAFVGLRQYAILIGFTAGLLNFIPYLGPVAGATPAVLWALLTSRLESWNERGLHVALIIGGFLLIQAFDGLVSQPFIVGKRASLHPLAVILALAIGAQAGLAGMIVAVPIACFVRVLWLELYWNLRDEPEEDEALRLKALGLSLPGLPPERGVERPREE